MVEEDEDDFIEDRPHRACASQVWRIWPLFELFLDNLALVWLFCRDFQSSLEILSHFLGDFQSFSLKIFIPFLWRFSVVFFGDFQSFFFGDFQ